MARAATFIVTMTLLSCASASLTEDAGLADFELDATIDSEVAQDRGPPPVDAELDVLFDAPPPIADARVPPVDAAPDAALPAVGRVELAGQASFYAHPLGEPEEVPENTEAMAWTSEETDRIEVDSSGGLDLALTVESGTVATMGVHAPGYADAFVRLRVHPESQVFVDLHLAPAGPLVCGDQGCATADGGLIVDAAGSNGAAFGPGHGRFFPDGYESVDGSVLEVLAFGWLDRSARWARLAVDPRHWSDLWDLRLDTGALEAQAYVYDPDRGWLPGGEGRLVDLAGRPILEAELTSLREGRFAREVYFEVAESGPGFFALARPRVITTCVRGKLRSEGPYQLFARGDDTLAHEGSTYDGFCIDLPRTEPEGVDDDGDGLSGEVRRVHLHARDGDGFLHDLGSHALPMAAARCGADADGCLDLGDRLPCFAERCDGQDNDCDGMTDEALPEVGMPCSPGGGIGRCRQVGIYVCDPAQGGLVCAGGPEPERCDGIDNDCDERIDEQEVACVVGEGRCQRVGRAHCIDGDEICSAVVGPPELERCDPVDWSCDGRVDDVEGTSQACDIDGGCGLLVCAAGQAALRCIPVPPGSLPEACDGEDNDCDGRVDEAVPGAGDRCIAGEGVCARSGWIQCLPEDGLVCDAVSGPAEPERCNGLDDDCNGAVDDVPGTGRNCAEGVGACARFGRMACDPILGVLGCDTAPLGEPTPEVCNEIDDDCNGVVDDVEGICDPGP